MATSRTRRKPLKKFIDGNVGASEARQGYGDIRLWVETPDEYQHSLYITVDEAERLADLLDQLLDELAPSE